MPIKKVKAPAASTRKYKGWVKEHQPDKKFRPGMLKFDEHFPHRVYHVGLHDLLDDLPFARAKQVSWRHIHKDPNGQHHAVEVRLGSTEGRHHSQEVHHGPMANALHAHFLALPEKKELRNTVYEVAFLRIFALKINTLWLKAPQPEHDYFVPIDPCFYGLIAGTLYPAEEFKGIVRQALVFFESMARDQLAGG